MTDEAPEPEEEPLPGKGAEPVVPEEIAEAAGTKKRRALQTHGLRSKVYVPVILRVFKQNYRKGLVAVPFTIMDIRQALVELGLAASNAPDVIYRMRSRTILPTSITKLGFNVLRSIARGRYQFEKAANTIFAVPLSEVTEALDVTPLPVRRLLPEVLADIDEQGLLSIVGYCKLLDYFTGLTVYRLRSHVRKSVEGVGQAEVDEVNVGVAMRDDEIPVVIPIEAKGADEPLNRVQVASQIAYAKAWFPGHEIRPIAIKLDFDSLLHFVEFSPTQKAADLQIIRNQTYRLKLSDVQRAAIREMEQRLRPAP